jgi:hypothetical protein
MDTIHHADLAADLSDQQRLVVGITKVPFGIQPYGSHSWWFGLPFYVGLNDDYDLGAAWRWSDDALRLDVALFKNAELSASDHERYSTDVVTDGEQQNEETNQANLRLAYTITHSADATTELGCSGQFGQLYNNTTDDHGHHWAAAAHAVTRYHGWDIQFEAMAYGYHPENPAGVDDDTILMGGFATSYPVAAEGQLYGFNVGHRWPVAWGRFTMVRVYCDYSHLAKEPAGFDDSQLNIVGVSTKAGGLSLTAEWQAACNVVYLGGGDDAFAAAADDGDWGHTVAVIASYSF